MKDLLNLAPWDRMGRALIGLVLLVVALTGGAAGIAAIVVGVLGVVLMATATIGVCPLYMPFRFRTRA